MDWKTLVQMIALSALGLNKKTAPLVPFVILGIQKAEDMKGKTGPEKLAIAIDIVKTGVAGTNAVRPGTLNVAVTDDVIASAISAVVDATNVFKKAGLIVNHPAPAA
jgi:hypothetical protein